MVFVSYVQGQGLKEEFLFSHKLEETIKGEDVKEKVLCFLEEEGLSWAGVCGMCTDGVPAMLGSKLRISHRSKGKSSRCNVCTLYDSPTGFSFKNSSPATA